MITPHLFARVKVGDVFTETLGLVGGVASRNTKTNTHGDYMVATTAIPVPSCVAAANPEKRAGANVRIFPLAVLRSTPPNRSTTIDEVLKIFQRVKTVLRIQAKSHALVEPVSVLIIDVSAEDGNTEREVYCHVTIDRLDPMVVEPLATRAEPVAAASSRLRGELAFLGLDRVGAAAAVLACLVTGPSRTR